MEPLIALAGTVVGAVAGGLATYLTTRSRLRLELLGALDTSVRERRLERYQRLFHLTQCLSRMYIEPLRREDLFGYYCRFHDWFFAEDGGGMFLTQEAKHRYTDMLNAIHMAALASGPALSDTEIDLLRRRASELRHQLSEDVGAAHPPRLRLHHLAPTPRLSTDFAAPYDLGAVGAGPATG
jgi:hypothetical protein